MSGENMLVELCKRGTPIKRKVWVKSVEMTTVALDDGTEEQAPGGDWVNRTIGHGYTQAELDAMGFPKRELKKAVDRGEILETKIVRGGAVNFFYVPEAPVAEGMENRGADVG